MEGPAETTGYMIAGYVVIFGTMLAYLASLVVRHRNLRADEAALKDLVQEEED
ncbi:MAG: hypothetical protein VB089_18115 [Anaerolineaceae bacterium]|nr:hypothetical protein [Anaerolineaceae bacterium]